VITIPNSASDTLVTLNGSQTLTNKILGSTLLPSNNTISLGSSGNPFQALFAFNFDGRGTYTPTIGDGTYTFTMTTQTGVYSQFGNAYFVSIHIIWSGKGSATGTIQITLPFTTASNGGVYAFSLGYNSGLYYTSTSTQVMASANSNANFVQLFGIGTSGTTIISASNLGTSGELQLSGWILT